MFRTIIPIIILILISFYTFKVKSDQNKFLEKVSSGQISSKYDKELFAGTWHSSRAKVNIDIKSDGGWVMGKTSGKWALQDEYFVWIYTDEDDIKVHSLVYEKLDKNHIVSVSENQFVLKEIDGSNTTFSRKKHN